MNHYEIWVNLQDSSKDMLFVEVLAEFMDRLQGDGLLERWSLKRRKLGFGPPELGEFNISILARDLQQLDDAFGSITPRTGEMERLHARVWGMVKDFRSALYRDFPDAAENLPVRLRRLVHQTRSNLQTRCCASSGSSGAGTG